MVAQMEAGAIHNTGLRCLGPQVLWYFGMSSGLGLWFLVWGVVGLGKLRDEALMGDC